MGDYFRNWLNNNQLKIITVLLCIILLCVAGGIGIWFYANNQITRLQNELRTFQTDQQRTNIDELRKLTELQKESTGTLLEILTQMNANVDKHLKNYESVKTGIDSLKQQVKVWDLKVSQFSRSSIHRETPALPNRK